MLCTTAYDIWRTLQVTHEGTTKVKQTKISILQNQFSSFQMKQNESIVDMYSRFQTIQHDLMALGVEFTNFDLISRILNSLTPEWERKVLAIEEANDLSTLLVEELIGNLMSYEANLQARKEQNIEKKCIAFPTINENSDLDEEEIVFITKNYNKIKKFRKMTKFQKGGKFNSSNQTSIKCYECDQFEHMKKDCPKLNNDKRKNQFENFKKKKAFKVTWDDSESSSSSESDSESDGEQANVCFMAQTDEVCPDLSYDELLELSMELDDKFRQIKKLNKEHITKIN